MPAAPPAVSASSAPSRLSPRRALRSSARRRAVRDRGGHVRRDAADLRRPVDHGPGRAERARGAGVLPGDLSRQLQDRRRRLDRAGEQPAERRPQPLPGRLALSGGDLLRHQLVPSSRRVATIAGSSAAVKHRVKILRVRPRTRVTASSSCRRGARRRGRRRCTRCAVSAYAPCPPASGTRPSTPWAISRAPTPFRNRTEGEAVLLDHVPASARRILDLGTGDGRLLALLRIDRARSAGVGLDVSEPMLAAARERFAGDAGVELVRHDMSRPLPDLGAFDAVVSCFAIHHLEHERKRSLFAEVFERLEPGAVFANLEHVRLADPAPPPALLHSHRLRPRLRGSVKPAPRRRDPARLAARGRLRGRRLLLEVARDGTAHRGQAGLRGLQSSAGSSSSQRVRAPSASHVTGKKDSSSARSPRRR